MTSGLLLLSASNSDLCLRLFVFCHDLGFSNNSVGKIYDFIGMSSGASAKSVMPISAASPAQMVTHLNSTLLTKALGLTLELRQDYVSERFLFEKSD
jgi:hypothetical protein